MITKEEALQYFKDHRENIRDLCEEFNLRYPYESREELMEQYKFLKNICNHWMESSNSERFYKAQKKLEQFEKTYHIFEPDFNEKSEARWIPEKYNKNAAKVFEYRKEIFETQNIWHDLELDELVEQDMSEMWDEKGGQEEMYGAFPFSFTKESIVRESDYYSDYLKSDCHYTTKIIRSYALGSSGGILIAEERTYSHYSDMTNITPEAQDSYSSRQIIASLGEDDGFHFLHGVNLNEQCCGSIEDFTVLLDMVIKEFTNYQKK